jgi:DNA topoisomerase I
MASGNQPRTMPRLRRSDPSLPGFARRRRGRGFVYLDIRGKRITDPEVVQRIKRHAVPPAWTDVWICPDPYGHLQAVGTDAAGRRQYLYHPQWRTRRDQQKFDRMLEFAEALPRLRRVTAADLSGAGLSRDRVLACAVRLLDRGFFRVGSEAYATDNGTFGLSTMYRAHVTIEDQTVNFDYPAKGTKRRVQSVVDPDALAVLVALNRRRSPDPQLLAYKQRGRWVDVRSDDINAYIKESAGEAYSAKDFRTWHGTVLAAMALAVAAPAARSKTSAKRAMSWAVKDVAQYLGNTPAVCRASYIDPRVFDRYRSGVTVAGVLDELGADRLDQPAMQETIEAAVIDLIREDESPALARTPEAA